MDGNGGCCIAAWTDGGHVPPAYDATQMGRIMLKFRPIAPKPVAANGAVVASSNGSPHAKVAGKGRRKSVNSKRSNGRKRKSSSPDLTPEIGPHDLDHHDRRRGGGGVTLLPLFPEAPDLRKTKQEEAKNMRWLDFNRNTLGHGDNYRMCHGYV